MGLEREIRKCPSRGVAGQVLRVRAPSGVGCGFAGDCGGRSDPRGRVPLGGSSCPAIRLEGEVQESPGPWLCADSLPSARPGLHSPRNLPLHLLPSLLFPSLPSSPPAFTLENGSEGERLPVALRLKDGKILATFPAPPPPEEESMEIEIGPCKWLDSKRFRCVGSKSLLAKLSLITCSLTVAVLP